MISLLEQRGEPIPPGGLDIGRGIPSGKGDLWRVFEIAEEALPLVAIYHDGDHEIPVRVEDVDTVEEWERLDTHGLQVVVSHGGVWKGADEYRLGGAVKYGAYLSDADFDGVLAVARGLAHEQGREILARG